MRRRAVWAAAALATLAVFAGAAFWFRELFVERFGDGAEWPRAVRTIEVDAAAGVQVSVVRIVVERTGAASDVAADAQWETRSMLGHADVTASEAGRVSARCHSPTPLSRCTIWLTVRTTTRETRVVILQRPGSVVRTTDPRVPVEVRQLP